MADFPFARVIGKRSNGPDGSGSLNTNAVVAAMEDVSGVVIPASIVIA